MIDLHCHVLPGIDDGPATLRESVELARAAAAQGTRVIVATPHVNARFANRAAAIAAAVARLNQALGDAGVELTVRPGAELAMTSLYELDADELAALALGGAGGRWLRLECPFTVAIEGFVGVVGELQRLGHRILLAHPERCNGFQRQPQRLAGLVEAGALASVTASSFDGRFGRDAHRLALAMVEHDLVHNVASDAHDSHRRPPELAAPLLRAGLEGQLDWLTSAIPAAILAGDDAMPPRPQVERPARRRRLFR